MEQKQYDNTNSGVLFNNERKQTDKQPDLSGFINVDGKEYWLSGWHKDSKAKGPMISLSVKPKEAGQQQARPTQAGFRIPPSTPPRPAYPQRPSAPAPAARDAAPPEDDEVPF